MTTITGDGTQPLALTTTGPSDGSIAFATDVNTAAQALLNGTVRLGTFYVADFTALTALTGVQPNERIFVVGYGLYRYNQASAAAVAAPVIINGHGGVGRFEWELMTAAGAASGLATLDSSGKVNQYSVNRIVSTAAVANNGATSTSSATYVAIPGMAITLSGTVAADILVIDWSLNLLASTHIGSFAIQMTDGGNANIAESVQSISTTVLAQISKGTVYTITTGGTVVVKMMYSNPLTGTTQLYADPYQILRVVQVRP